MQLNTPEPVWLDTNEALETHCQQWSELNAIALDTEFIRTDTFYPQPGLIQVGTGEAIFLIDPLAIDQWQPFKALLENPGVIKVLHACSEDLEVFKLLTGAVARPLFDTQLAAAFANLGYSLGYQKLIKQLLDIDLPKDETRSNWRQRPLTPAQISYASLDVADLLAVYQTLDKQLSPSDKKAWLEDECLAITQNVLTSDPDNAWRDVKRAWQLQPQQLGVLKALCYFRETRSRELDVPRNRVIPKGSLWPLAKFQPVNDGDLRRIPDMHSNILRQHGDDISNIIKHARQMPESQLPKRLPPPLPKAARDWGKRIKKELTRRASELDLPQELLTPSRLATPILKHWFATGEFALPDTLIGWRRAIIGEPLIRHLQQSSESQ